MNVKKIHPELRKAIGRMPSMPIHHRLGLSVIRWMSKLMLKSRPVSGVTVEERKLGSAIVRIYRPEKHLSGAGLLWIHGGGLIMGFAAMNDNECFSYAKKLNLVVVSVEYRLAPEHQFPAAIDDCFEAWKWFQAAAGELGVDPSRIAVAGQSAGGGLSASLAQRIYDEGGVQPASQVLIYPMLDDRTAAREELDLVKHRMWNNKNNRGGWTWYLGGPPGKPDTPPYAVPARREDLSGLPPTWIGVGDVDLFYEESCQYAQRLTDAGVECQLYTVSMAPHGFEILVPESSVAKTFNSEIYQFLRESLA